MIELVILGISFHFATILFLEVFLLISSRSGVGVDNLHGVVGVSGYARWAVTSKLEPGGGLNIVALPNDLESLDQVKALSPFLE